MNRRRSLGAIAALPVAAGAADAPLVEETRTIDAFSIVGRSLEPGAQAVRGIEFLPRRDAGPLWILLDIVALRDGSGRDEMVFELSLLDMPMQPTDTVQIVKGSRMARPDAARWPRDERGNLTSPSRGALPGAEQDALAAGLAADQVRRVVVIREVAIQRPALTRFGLQVTRLQGLRPLRVEVQLGQGPVPREARAYADGVNGTGLKRYANEAAMIGSGVLLGALAIWRLRR